MRRLKLELLKCYETEDWLSDECRLEMRVDGAIQPALCRSMEDGDRWPLNASYTFKDNVAIRLYDEDSSDSDDFLGEVVIGTALRNDATANFTRDDANYRLWYSVIDIPDVDPVDQAIQDFEQSTKPGVWPSIDKAALLRDIRDTLWDHFNVNQGKKTPLCGPAALTFELVSRHKRRYVELCQQLYETGSFRGKTKTVAASATLRNSPIRVRDQLSVADWMFMATLRDAENELFAVDAESGNYVLGITTPWELKGWASELLGYSKVEFESTFFYGELDALRKAHRVWRRGGVAFLLINSAMLGNPAPMISYPDHWVSYLGGLKTVDEGHGQSSDIRRIQFNCYSWGRSVSVDLGEGAFEEHMWGVVTGEL